MRDLYFIFSWPCFDLTGPLTLILVPANGDASFVSYFLRCPICTMMRNYAYILESFVENIINRVDVVLFEFRNFNKGVWKGWESKKFSLSKKLWLLEDVDRDKRAMKIWKCSRRLEYGKILFSRNVTGCSLVSRFSTDVRKEISRRSKKFFEIWIIVERDLYYSFDEIRENLFFFLIP